MRDRRRLGCTIAAAAMAACAAPASAAIIDVHRTGHTGVVQLDGEIVGGDAQRLAYVVRRARASGVKVGELRLSSLGGDILEGVHLADAVARLKLKTVIASGQDCASACFFAFSAGSQRIAHTGGRLGVHGVSEREGETGRAKSMTVDMARVLANWHVPPEVIGQMVLTPPDRMRWLTAAELKQMGVQLDPDKVASLPEPSAQRGR